MASLLVTACDGLHTQPNENGELPPGACAVADNVQISRDGIVECRRGFESAVTAAAAVVHLTPYQGTLIAQTSSKVYQSNAAVSTLTEVGSATNSTTHPEGATPQGTFAYLTDAGVQVWETGRTVAAAGVPTLGAPLLTAKASGSMQATGTQLAYRAVLVRKPGTGTRTQMGPPSGRSVIANVSGSTQDVYVSVRFMVSSLAQPQQTPWATADAIQFYRSLASASGTTDPGDELGLIYERTDLPSSISITGFSRTATTVTVTTAAAHKLQPGDIVYHSAVTNFPEGEFIVETIPSTTTFTYTEAGVATTGGAPATQYILAIGVLDNVPDSLVGAALYTNATQDGIQQANEPPPLVYGDVAEFRGCTFYGYAKDRESIDIVITAVGGTSDFVVGNRIYVGTSVVVGAATENYGYFQVFTAGTPAENIANTAMSIARGIVAQSNGAYEATYTSGPTDAPGKITFRAASPSAASFRVYTQRFPPDPTIPQSFIGPNNGTSSSTTFKSRVYYSRQQMPEAVPLLNYFDVGDSDSAILRLVPLRDALIVLKQDGVFRITGDGPWNFRVDPFDLTIRCSAPDTAAALENTVIMLTDHGVARVSDTGITILSRPIEDQLRPFLVPSMRSAVDTYAFAVGQDSTHRYMIWLPTASSDTQAQVAFVYDLFTETWVKWTNPARHGVVNPADDKVYISNGTAILKERKDWASTDYQDASSATIAAAVEWTPKFGDRPDALHQFREVGLVLGSAEWAAADIGFATDLEPTLEYVALPTMSTSGQVLRVLVPRTKQRGSRLRVRFRQTQAGKAFQIKGLRVMYETASERVRK